MNKSLSFDLDFDLQMRLVEAGLKSPMLTEVEKIKIQNVMIKRMYDIAESAELELSLSFGEIAGKSREELH
ncbi:hypothetical protein DOJK_01321 [Patescibacteria group bacterium]|nr:hypothetical protein DOJK_01321 [Patescibacteria group bacterium]